MRQIPKKNYIILFGLSIGTVILLIYVSSLYKSYQFSKDKNYEIQSVLSTITMSDVDNYIQENPNIVLYISNSDNESVNSFETEFKKYIKDNDLSHEIVYLNTTGITNDDFNKIANYYNDAYKVMSINLLGTSNLLFFEDGKIEDIMYLSNKDINIADVKIFLEKNNVLGERDE